MTEPLLVADIGGTNARFALAVAAGGAIQLDDVLTYAVADFKTLREAAAAYLKTVKSRPLRASFAVAAPVEREEIAMTNAPWRFRPEEIKAALALRDLLIVNDFYALAASVSYLGDDSFVTVKAGAGDAAAPSLVVGPGTGFGQSLIVPAGAGRNIIATQGGHVSFAPQSEEQMRVMKLIAQRYGRASVERLLSGPGLVNIYWALCAAHGDAKDALSARDITMAAKAGKEPVAVKAVNMFCDILGSVAGDAALATGARGGVFLGGGVLPKIRDLFLASGFIDSFLDKGRMRDYVDAIPVRMIVKREAALVGAAAAFISAER